MVIIIVLSCNVIHATVHFNLSTTGFKERWIITGPVTDDKWIVEHFRAIPTFTGMKIHMTGLVDGGGEFGKYLVCFKCSFNFCFYYNVFHTRKLIRIRTIYV